MANGEATTHYDGFPTNPERYWFSIFGGLESHMGWCFGATEELAFAAAVKATKRWAPDALKDRNPIGSVILISLQRDVSPAVYFSRYLLVSDLERGAS